MHVKSFYAHSPPPQKKHNMQIEKEGLPLIGQNVFPKRNGKAFDDSFVNDICGSCQQIRYVCPFVTHHVL